MVARAKAGNFLELLDSACNYCKHPHLSTPVEGLDCSEIDTGTVRCTLPFLPLYNLRSYPVTMVVVEDLAPDEVAADSHTRGRAVFEIDCNE